MIGFVQDMGREIARRWSVTNFDNLALPDLACEVLLSTRPAENISHEGIADWLSITDSIPAQPNIDSTFGQPPVTLFWHPRFYIEALHWLTATTQIHQHGFSGAFCVLAGSSLQSRYVFTCERRVNTHMLFGDLSLEDVSLLSQGDVRPIRSGTALIHSVFHLDFPSVTLVVRTHSDIDSKPQYNYLPPFLAVDPSFSEPLSQRRLESLEFLHRVGSARFPHNATRSLAGSDLPTTFRLLRGLGDICDPDLMNQLLEVAKRSHGDDIDRIWACVRESQRQRVLIKARERIKSPDSRFFLALLLNVRSRQAILSAVHARYPSRDPTARLLDGCFALSRAEVGVEFDDLNKALFAHLIEGLSMDDVLTRLRTDFSPEDVDTVRPGLVAQCRTLREDSVFRHLLAES